jgi:hypothetical protein
MNATDLFLLNHENFHSSESSWSSLFAYQILDASRQGVELRIPIFVYRQAQGRWYFEEQENGLLLPPHLNFSSVVIEGKFRTGCIPGMSDPLPMKFNDLRPDVTLLLDSSLALIETKTIGARITQKEQLYFDLCEWLIGQGISAKPYILLSAGHQPDSDVCGLCDAQWKQVPTLILWEQFFKAIEQQVRDPLVSRLIPNLKRYYEPEEEYLRSNIA